MRPLKGSVQWRTRSGDPIAVGDVTLTPEARALTVRWPRGGWVWNRPVAIWVEKDEHRQRVPVVDVTGWAQVGLLSLSAILVAIGIALAVAERNK